ncbi:MAG: RNA-binding transcriptional accessory protein [Bacteroidetes bacterium GWF2_41_31]|nr:MAG: RNA-binding transcriptional accessory protein [Bacteroidetes bacterium GWF2_41_31]
MQHFIESLSTELNVSHWQINNTIELLDSDATIPFIARYRKEKTGALTDEQIIEIDKKYKQHKSLVSRKESILNSMRESGQLTPALEEAIQLSESLTLLEDIYLPYKPKRQTRGVKAISKGLEPLARMIMSENVSDVQSAAQRFVNDKTEVFSTDEAISGARDIIAEWVSEKDWVRQNIRRIFEQEAILTSKVVASKAADDDKYQSWHDWQELAIKTPSHRALAMFRGENEGFLKLKLIPDKQKVIHYLDSKLVKGGGEASKQKSMAIADAVGRLLFPSLENELRALIKQNADETAIRVFSTNLKQLLLMPPLGQKNVLAIDPGFRTGCKVVCLDKNGNLVHNATIYPHAPQHDTAMAVKKIKSLVSAYDIEAIAIGNGTAGRETAQLIEHIRFDKDIVAVSVSENGASVYSASALAREEFGQYDVTVRGAVSIGRRLIDPLAEFVKIDPKALGVGQYQHDVDQKLLKESLTSTVELCVNQVGVELNTASKQLLTYVSGLGPKLAAQIIEYRNQKGDFDNRESLKKVPGLGPKAFQQAAGFLRIKEGTNLLDTSAVHPENYAFVNKLSSDLSISIKELVGNWKILRSLQPESLVTEETGLFTVKDILAELEKPGRDPRGEIQPFSFDPNVKHISSLREGMVVPGIVTNITAFGAFVDIGLHESALLHKSEMASEFVKNPSDYVALNQQLMVRIKEVDVEKKRIALSLLNIL